jgi:hypothetical protein
VLDILHMFQIKEQIDYFILDNVENNNIIMEMIDGDWGLMGSRGAAGVSAILLIWLLKPYYLAKTPMLLKNS